MSEREENVYKAKLAEQAERYDGEYEILYLPTYARRVHNVILWAFREYVLGIMCVCEKSEFVSPPFPPGTRVLTDFSADDFMPCSRPGVVFLFI